MARICAKLWTLPDMKKTMLTYRMIHVKQPVLYLVFNVDINIDCTQKKHTKKTPLKWTSFRPKDRFKFCVLYVDLGTVWYGNLDRRRTLYDAGYIFHSKCRASIFTLSPHTWAALRLFLQRCTQSTITHSAVSHQTETVRPYRKKSREPSSKNWSRQL